MLHKMQLFGTTTVGERGQIVLPVDLRKTHDIAAGDKLLVLSRQDKGGPIVLVDADSVTRMLEEAGEALEEITKKVSDAGK